MLGPVLTITANPLAETTAYYGQLQWGKTHRASRMEFQMGGKGINVAKMAARLEHATTAWTFLGGRSGQRCRDWLRAQSFAHEIIPVDYETREGWVVREEQGRETSFFGVDHPLPFAAWQHLCQRLPTASAGMLCALCGSIPGWTSRHTEALREVFADWQQRSALLALDTYGAPLRALVEFPWDLVKINRDELNGLTGTPEADVAEALLRLRASSPVRTWIVTDGPRPVHLLDQGRPIALQAPNIQVVSPTGSGDVLLAVLLHFRSRELSWETALTAALPYAAANAAHAGVADFPLRHLPR